MMGGNLRQRAPLAPMPPRTTYPNNLQMPWPFARSSIALANMVTTQNPSHFILPNDPSSSYFSSNISGGTSLVMAPPEPMIMGRHLHQRAPCAPRGPFVPVVQNQQSSFLARKGSTQKEAAQKSQHSAPPNNNKRGRYNRLSTSEWKDICKNYYLFLLSNGAGNCGSTQYCNLVLKTQGIKRKTFQNHWPKELKLLAENKIPLDDPRVKSAFEKQFPSP
jgi:hypothetical protein